MRDPEKERVRDELLDRVRKELLGPNFETEELAEGPCQRYLCGILWPSGLTLEETEDEGLGAGQEGEETGSTFDVQTPTGQAMRPASIGLSFVVDGDCRKLRVSAKWGVYSPITKEAGARPRWQRAPMHEVFDISLTTDGERHTHPSTKDAGVVVEWLARTLDDKIAVSLFLVNRKPRPESGPMDALCIFQPRLTVAGMAEGATPFAVHTLTSKADFTARDVMQDNLLFRHRKEFAVGHGTAVEWSGVTVAGDRAALLSTVTIPAHEVARVIPPPWSGGGSLNMQELADAASGDAIFDCLDPLLQAYEDWIRERELELDQFTGDLLTQAEDHLRQCRKALRRMRTGLDLVRNRPEVFEAFRFANRAMAWQRTQVKWAQTCRKSKDWSQPPTPVQSEWRPFQIAFILQALTGIVEPTHEDRQIADLLWFPTGGGKTEAYLGLSAFVMALRRLRGEQGGKRGDAGLTVIMRYTLRLLTIQQFQRASSLICACELLRQQDPKKWGTEPFRIGLWVGGSATPNNFDDCADALSPNPRRRVDGSPVQLVACPWCGHPLLPKHYRADAKKRRVFINCSRTGCEFHVVNREEGIPALVEDEEIYRLAPSLLIGTVDKFARIAWEPETQALFGKVRGQVPGWGFVVEGEGQDTSDWRQQALSAQKLTETLVDGRALLAPELIIQDELHLISGPLGTMVGLYETAIDALSAREVAGQVVGPKVIASTATIRKAETQVQALFARRAAIFPPSGLEAGDSFFAQAQALDHTAGRLYVGIFAPGRSVKTALVRLYAVLLGSTGAVSAAPKDIDPYYTLIGYFNSLRELGGAVRLLEDDVPARMGQLATPQPSGRLYDFVPRGLPEEVDELTSRVDSRDIPVVLDRLDRVYTGKSSKEPPVEVVLASNMISVGVDVSRLGLMAVTGQPKTTAEYIQATSRVGREYPGLVCTVYNWARPRDLSHYERFGHYHATLYRHVEAISVTPFSARARDRGLAATFIALCRQRVKEMAAWRQAVKFRAGDSTVQYLRWRLLQRVEAIGQPERMQDVQNELSSISDTWHNAALKGVLNYSGRPNPAPPLMYQLGDRKKSGLFGVPNSMRDVETPIRLYLLAEGGSKS